ncbi:MAG: polyisoprenoid-binding protein [Chitinophagaceae bacterium]|nr:MAG: polyisoprenoid-binding protein [Chitinophagaceae bacterium]
MANTKWTLDPIHSELGFKIKHLMISHVSGSFRNFSVDVSMEDNDFSTANVQLSAEMASLFTNNEQRDSHLRNSDFFEVEKYPELTFRSTKVVTIDEDMFTLYGDLTLKGVTKPVQLNVEYSGVTKDPWGGERTGFVVAGKIKRTDWGINFNSLLETGGVALGEEVKILSEIQLVKQAVEVAA